MKYAIADPNIIVRDLKSPNVLVAGDMTLKICDFGSSLAMAGNSKLSTFAGTVAWLDGRMLRRRDNVAFQDGTGGDQARAHDIGV